MLNVLQDEFFFLSRPSDYLDFFLFNTRSGFDLVILIQNILGNCNEMSLRISDRSQLDPDNNSVSVNILFSYSKIRLLDLKDFGLELVCHQMDLDFQNTLTLY